MVATAATSPLDFGPGDTLAEQILIDLSSPDASLSSVAAKHNLPTATLSLWLTKPETQALLHAIESGGYAHTRLAASLNLSAAVPVLLQILTDFRTLSKSTTDLTGPVYQRASIHARKAAWMLHRLAGCHPLTPAQRSAARDTIVVTRTVAPHHDAVPPANLVAAEVAEPNALAWRRDQGAEQRQQDISHGPAPTPPPTPAPKATAIPTSTTEAAAPDPHATPVQPARAEPVPSITAEFQPATTSTPPDDLSDLVAKLASIAESLGIDISELDQFDDLENLDDLNDPNDLHATAPNHATGPPEPTGQHTRQSA